MHSNVHLNRIYIANSSIARATQCNPVSKAANKILLANTLSKQFFLLTRTGKQNVSLTAK